MRQYVTGLVAMGLAIVAAFPSSSNYILNTYSVGPGGTSDSTSTTYHGQGSAGEQATGASNGSTLTSKNGSIETEQINVPGTPTLSNGSGTYYNKLNVTIDTSNDPTDATYSIAVSTDNFASNLTYVQADGTLGGSRVYQTYTAWGGGSGSLIIGLSPSTTYYVKVDAMQGLFTNTAYSAVASLATVAPTLSFSVSPNSSSFSNIIGGSISTSSNISFTFSTNGASGGSIYVRGANAGFVSPSQSYTVPAISADLSGQAQGFGIQATNPNQSSGGPLTTVSPYNGAGNVVGAETVAFAQMLTSGAAIAGGTATANVQVKVLTTAPAVSDYAETFSFIASASF